MKKLVHPVLIIVLVSSVLGASVLTRGHDWGDDFASYIMQAQSILNGSVDVFVERNAFTIFESSFQIGPVAYPWGYPLVLVPVVALKGVHPLTLKVPGLIFFAGFLICLYFLTRNRLTQIEGLLFVSVFAFNPALVGFLDQITSDIPFLFFTTLSLLMLMKQEDMSGTLNAVFLGTVIFLSFFIRTTGSILLATFLLHQAICFYSRKEKRKDISIRMLYVLLIFVSLVFLSSLIFPNGQGSYFAILGRASMETIRDYASSYASLIGAFFGTSPAWMFLFHVLINFFIIGALARLRDDQPMVIFFILYFLAIIIWPEWQGMRFIFPLIPIFVYFVFQGIQHIISSLGRAQTTARYGLHLFWLGVISIFFFTSASLAYQNLQGDRQTGGPFDPYSREVYKFIKENTPADSVIVFFKPRAMRLMTDRNAFLSTDCDGLVLGDYVAISKKAENSQLSPYAVDDCEIPLIDVFENRRFIVYQIQKQ